MPKRVNRSQAYRLQHEKYCSIKGCEKPLYKIRQKVAYGWDDEWYVGVIIDKLWNDTIDKPWNESAWEYQISPDMKSYIGDDTNLWWSEKQILPVEVNIVDDQRPLWKADFNPLGLRKKEKNAVV